MPKSTLTWYKTRTRRIMRDIKALKQKDIAAELNASQQVISYRINNCYEKELTDWIRILNLAGYEIKEREE